jgi:hypothetical protein
MESAEFIEKALQELDGEVSKIMSDITISMVERDKIMLPLVQKKRVLVQTLKDLKYLDSKFDSQLQSTTPTCKMSSYR